MAEIKFIKVCTRCRTEKPIADFYQRRNGRVESWCKVCCSLYRADYYEQHRDQIKERRGPYNREYSRRAKQDNPGLRLKSIETVRAWWAALSPEEKKRLNQRKKLLKRYGLTLEQWDAMKAAQSGACALCKEVPEHDKLFHVDHCHATGRVRGLLCVRCNTALAWFEKMASGLDRVKAYLAV